MSVRKHLGLIVGAVALGFFVLFAAAGYSWWNDGIVLFSVLNGKVDPSTVEEVQRAFAQARIEQGGLAVLASAFFIMVALCVALVCYLRRAIFTPLRQLQMTMVDMLAAGKQLSKRQFTVDVDFSSMQQTLRELVGIYTQKLDEIGVGMTGIVSQSALIVQNATDLGSRTDEQASALQQTASSMQQLSSTVTQNADNARQADELARSASSVAQKGGQVMEVVIQTMGGISDHSRKVSDIVAVIDSIAFQTNILALNAAVEAARAGEQGKGFAVVASEVRNLASRSAQAAKEVKTLIDRATGEVDAGHKLVEQAGKTMGDIVDSISKVTTIMGEIASASNEQASGIDQINQAVSQMDNVMQHHAELVRTSSAAAADLRDQAIRLSGVEMFKPTQKLSQTQTTPVVRVKPTLMPRTRRDTRAEHVARATVVSLPRRVEPAVTPNSHMVTASATLREKLMSPVTGHHANMDDWESF